jgi:cell division protein FtsQ
MPESKGKRPRRTAKRRRLVNPLPFLLVCAALVLFMSLLFRVGEIEVVGSTMYTDAEIIAAAGIQEGDNLFFINRSTASSRITAKLPAIDTAVVERRLPDTIRINVSGSAAVAWVDVQGVSWSLDRGLRYLNAVGAAEQGSMVHLRGVAPESAIPGERLQLDAADALEALVTNLEGRGMLPYVTWIEAGELTADGGAVEFDYLSRYTVRMSLAGDVDYELQKVISATNQLSATDRALLDLTIDDKVHYIPR